jgi:hypothetical protein
MRGNTRYIVKSRGRTATATGQRWEPWRTEAKIWVQSEAEARVEVLRKQNNLREYAVFRHGKPNRRNAMKVKVENVGRAARLRAAIAPTGTKALVKLDGHYTDKRPNDGRSGRCGIRISGDAWCVLDVGHDGEHRAPAGTKEGT